MPRSKKRRRIGFCPTASYYKPVGIPLRDLEEEVVSFEELEALRRQVLLDENQEKAATAMGISQPTFFRLFSEAKKKVVKALVHGKAIKVEGGHYMFKEKEKTHQILAVSTNSQGLEGEISQRFGRSPYFLIVKIEEGKVLSFQSIENIVCNARRGVGTTAAQKIADYGVDGLITGYVGPRAMDVLEAFQIQIYIRKGKIQEAINSVLQGDQ